MSDSNRDVLIVAAEDYTGASPVQTGGLKYLSYYQNALAANGEQADVYDVDARDRTAPDHLGVLSHYDAVIWYIGDDIVTRRAGWTGGNADRLALDEILEFREYMNEGGNVLYTGAFGGFQYAAAPGVGQQFYDPKGEGPCLISGAPNPAFDSRRCLACSARRAATGSTTCSSTGSARTRWPRATAGPGRTTSPPPAPTTRSAGSGGRSGAATVPPTRPRVRRSCRPAAS